MSGSTNDDPSENVKQTEAKEAEGAREEQLPAFLDVFKAIAALHTRHQDIEIKYTSLGVEGYGPKEWTATVEDSIPIRYDVIYVGEERNVFVVKKPLLSISYTNVDSFLESRLRMIEPMVKRATTYLNEPHVLNYDSEVIYPPESLGLPLENLQQGAIPQEDVMRAVKIYCNSSRRKNPNYGTAKAFEGLNFGILRNAFHDIQYRDMPFVRDRIEKAYSYTLDGAVKPTSSIRLHSANLVHVVATPFLLNNVFDRIPRKLQLTSGLVLEALMPEINISPMTASDLMTIGGMSTARMTLLNAFMNISYSPVMQSEIAAYIGSLIVPGYFSFDIDFADCANENSYFKCLVAMAAKVLFSYSNSMRNNSLTSNSVVTIEEAIVACGVEAGVLAYAPTDEFRRRNIDKSFPLSHIEMTTTHRERNFHLATLQTDGEGSGWRDAQLSNLVADPGMPDVTYKIPNWESADYTDL